MTEENEVTISEIPESYQRYLDEIHDISRKRKGGWVSNKDISESLGVEPASVTGMLEKLKTAGYIKAVGIGLDGVDSIEGGARQILPMVS